MLGGALLVTLLAYLRCLGNGFVFDDHEMIVINRYIGQWSFLWRSLLNDSWWFRDPLHLPQSSYYRPLQDVWLGIHYQLFGLNPAGWHATMVALHLVSVWMVFEIAARLTQEWWAALLAALLFAMLPLHAEAVVWPAAIPLPLSATFELGALYFLIAGAGAERRKRPFALLLYAAALFTHESAVVFPGLVGLYAFLLESPAAPVRSASPGFVGSRIRNALIRLAPFAAEALLYLLVRWMVLGFINRSNPVNHATNAQALLTVPQVIATYLGLLMMPWLAGPSHRLLFVTSAASPEFYLPAGALLMLAGAFLMLVRGDPRQRLYLFCVAWIGIAIAPMMNLRGLFQQALVQDRYLYLASVGWCVMVADWAIRVANRGAPARRLVWGGAAALLLVYAAALWNVQRFWHDEVALFTRCIEKFPESAIWHNRLGMALEERGDLAGAERELKTSLNLDPDDGATLYDLGMLHARLGRVKDGAKEAAEALKLLSHPPPYAYIALAQLYDASGDRAQTEEALKQAESLPGGDRAAGLARASIEMEHGDPAAAEKLLRDLAARYAKDYRVWSDLGVALDGQNRSQEALSAYERAMALAPGDAQTHSFAAQTLHKMGRNNEAAYQCRWALALDPNDSNARALMAEIARGTMKH